MDCYYTSVPLFMSLYQNGLRAVGSITPSRAFYPEEWQAKKFRLPVDTFKVKQNVKLPQLLAVCHTNADRTKHYLTTATPVSECKVQTHQVGVGRLRNTATAPRYAVPETRTQYNSAMSGVDLNNQYCARPTLWRQADRWWISIFLHFLNVAVVNSWYLRINFGPRTAQSIKLPAFRLELMKQLVGDFTARKQLGRPPAVAAAPHHTNAPPSIIKNPDEKRGKCSVCYHTENSVTSGSFTSFECSKCRTWVCKKMNYKKKKKGEESCWALHMNSYHKHCLRPPEL